jgi:hypothetical protein
MSTGYSAHTKISHEENTSNGPSETDCLRRFQEQKNEIKKTRESELDKIHTQQPKTTWAAVKADLHEKMNRTRESEEKTSKDVKFDYFIVIQSMIIIYPRRSPSSLPHLIIEIKMSLWHTTLNLRNAKCRRLVVRYLELNRRERKSARSISCEYKAWGFRLVRPHMWSNSPTFSIDVLCYWDWFFSLSFTIFRGFLPDVLNMDLSSLFIVDEPPHRV